jgi:hypothetical protein
MRRSVLADRCLEFLRGEIILKDFSPQELALKRSSA